MCCCVQMVVDCVDIFVCAGLSFEEGGMARDGGGPTAVHGVPYHVANNVWRRLRGLPRATCVPPATSLMRIPQLLLLPLFRPTRCQACQPRQRSRWLQQRVCCRGRESAPCLSSSGRGAACS